MSNDARRTLGALTLLLATIWCLPAPMVHSQDQAAQDAKDLETLKRLRESSRRLLDHVAKDLQRPESRPHDLQARVELLGRDAAKIREYVRKEIRFEAYPGIQRGPAGVLVSGAGNAPDKAFLLAELLKAAGFEARVVKGTLPREKAEALVRSGLAAIKARPPHRFEGPFGEGLLKKEALETVCKGSGLVPDEALRMLAGDQEKRKIAWSDILDLSAREQAFLKTQLEAAKIEAPERPVLEELIQAAQGHAWVQWRPKGAGDWADVETCLADVPEGKAPVASEGELDPAATADRFMVALSLERKVGDKVETVDVFRQEVPAFETLLRPLRLVIQPTLSKLPEAGEKVGKEELYKRMQGYREFFAVFSFGEDDLASMVFDYEGTVDKAQLANGLIGRAMVKAVQGAAGAFDPGPAAPKAGKGELRRLWIDLRASRGGKALWSQRRNLLEEGKQASWSPILKWSFFLQSHEISRSFARFIRLSQRLQNDAALQSFTDWMLTKDLKHMGAMLEAKGGIFPVDLLDLCRARQAYVDGLAGGGAALHFPAPNLYLSGQQVRLHDETKKICSCYGIDIVENGALVLQSAKASVFDRESTRALGVFDTVLEQARLKDANEGEAVEGTVNFFERVRALALPIRVLSASDGKALAEALVPASDIEWIRANADPRSVVVVAADAKAGHCAAAYAWWSVDPRTGQTVGRLSGGRGGAEVAVLRNSMVETAHKYANAVCMAAAFALIFAGESGNAAGAIVLCQLVGMGAKGVALIPGVGPALAVVIFVADMIFSVGEAAAGYGAGPGAGEHE